MAVHTTQLEATPGDVYASPLIPGMLLPSVSLLPSGASGRPDTTGSSTVLEILTGEDTGIESAGGSTE